MIPNQTIYVMGKTKRRNTPCGKCKIPVKLGKKYIIDPENTDIIYHADCYNQKYKKSQK